MAISKKKTDAKKQDTLTEVVTAKVRRAHDFGNGQISFDAEFDKHTVVYGMKYIEGTKKDGTEYAFISFPQIKGNDGNYYNTVYMNISEEVKEDIISQLDKMLNE